MVLVRGGGSDGWSKGVRWGGVVLVRGGSDGWSKGGAVVLVRVGASGIEEPRASYASLFPVQSSCRWGTFSYHVQMNRRSVFCLRVRVLA